MGFVYLGAKFNCNRIFALHSGLRNKPDNVEQTIKPMESLIAWDHYFFELLNGVWTNEFLDQIMPLWRDKKTWYPLYLLIIGFSLYQFKWRGLYFILVVVLSIGLADFCSSQILKKKVQRLRPCNNTEMQAEVRLLVGCGRAYSFTSSHAANHFAIATFISLTLGLIYRKIRWPLHLFHTKKFI